MVDVEKDLHDAYELIAQEDYIPGLPYSLVSPIYKGTNENMNCNGYIDALSNDLQQIFQDEDIEFNAYVTTEYTDLDLFFPE